MKSKLNPILSAVLICVLFIVVLASCGSGEEDAVTEYTEASETTAEATAGTTEISDNLGEYDFEGYEFSILVFDAPYHNPYHLFEADEMVAGEPLNDAKMQVIRNIEDRFKVTFKESSLAWGTEDSMKKLIRSGDATYDLFYPMDIYAHTFVLENMLANYAEMPAIDLSRPYWDQALAGDASLLNQIFFAFGAFDMTYYDMTHIMLFNKPMFSDMGLPSPYEMVSNGTWTFDKMTELMKSGVKDLDGDGVMKDTDSFGYVSVPKYVLPNFWMAAGEKTIKKDENDAVYFAMPGNQRFIDIFDRVFTNFWDTDIWCRNTEGENTYSKTNAMFAEKRALFASSTFFYVNQFRSIETDFGILPYPKFDSTQEKYYSRVEGGGKIACVPTTNTNLERTGVLLEALTCEAYKRVIPAYYDVSLKIKNTRDNDSEAVLDLVFQNRIYDLGDTWYCFDIRDGLFANMFKDNKRDLTSIVEKNTGKIEKLLQKTMDSFSGQ